jgi:hypothetical protein
MDQGDNFRDDAESNLCSCHLLWLSAFFATASSQNSAPQPNPKDPLKAVAVYSGKWHSEDESFDTKFSKPSKESVDFVNDCSTQHEFFVCHQETSKASGTSSSMMVFLWNGKARLFETYVMDTGGGDPYHGHLTVDGDTFTWGSAAEKESGTRWRTLNLISGRDRIIYRVQFSTDEGKTWTTTREGKETRVSQ